MNPSMKIWSLQSTSNRKNLPLLDRIEDIPLSFARSFLSGSFINVGLPLDFPFRVHACIEKLYNTRGRELRRALFSLKQIFQDDEELVHEFVARDGLTCLVKVGAEADQNYQNYILRALGQIMIYVDGMNRVAEHIDTLKWLYSLLASRVRTK